MDDGAVLRLGIDESAVACCGLSPSSLLLAACSNEKRLKIWQTHTWNIVMERFIYAAYHSKLLHTDWGDNGLNYS